MIAAGSLFTSCVTNTEPQGIKDLREAKADYLASLSKLREADAELVKAQAAYQSAQIAVVEADAALKQALANIAQALADAAQLGVEYLDAELQMKLEADKAAAEIAAVQAQEDLAKQQAQLETALRKIAAESIGLTEEEKLAITEKTVALNGAYDTYNAWLDAYNGAEKELWYAEYNVAAGKEGYETADSYRASIADLQAQIVDLQANIASYEALKAEPAGIKDTLDAIAEEITALDAEITTKENVRKLYEASVPFKDAMDEYTKRWDKFKEDSLGNVGDFKFFDVDEDGDTVAVEYALTDGKGVDKKFGDIIKNNNWAVSERVNQSGAVVTFYHLVDDGFNYAKNAVQVGKTKIGYATPEQLTEGLDVLDQIVETLNRELVVIDNIKDSTSIEDAKKAAHVADSAYKADRKILEIGYDKSAFAKKVTDSLAKLAADTVAAKAAYTTAAAELKTKEADVKAKDSAKIVAVRTAAAAYNAAVDAMATAVKDYSEEEDSTAFINAIEAFGIAKATFNGIQDSLSYEIYDPFEAGKKTTYKDAFSEVNPSYFKEGTDHPVYKEKFLDVVQTVFDGGSFTMKKKELIAGLKYNPLKEKSSATDSIAVLKDKNLAVKAAVAAYNAASTARDALAKKISDTLQPAFSAKLTAYKTYKANGTKEAKAEYVKIYNKFWGYDENKPQEGIFDPYKFTWTDKTFLEPENCVEFTYSVLEEGIEAKVLFNSTLKTILDNVDPDGYLPEKTTPNMHRIFRSEVSAYNLTEFAQALLAAQIVEDLGEYVPNKARLEKINAQVAQIREDVEAAIAEYEAAQEGLDEVYARFYGVDEDGKLLPAVRVLTDASIVEGKWTLGGYQLAWAEELAPEYPGIVKEAVESIKPLQTRKANLAKFKRTLDRVYTAWWNEFEKDGKRDQRNVAAIVKHFETQIDDLNDQIDVLNGDIARYEEIIAACEAGYSPAEAKVAPLKKKVEAYKKYLEQAEEALARAQKEYDEVIAKYGVRDAE